jgi:hypothetical protein
MFIGMGAMARRFSVVLQVLLFGVALCPAGDSLFEGMKAPEFTLPFASKDTTLHAGIRHSTVVGLTSLGDTR